MTTRTPTAADFERAQANYKRIMARYNSIPAVLRLAYSLAVRLWSAFPGHLSLLCAIALTFAVCRFGLAVEVPDRIVAAIAAVETGTEWRNTGDVRGKWSRGADGEVSPFQLSPAALTDMGVTNHARVHRDVVFAESLARLWLARCYAKAGNWPHAIARYNAGNRYRSLTARDYAARVIAIASAL